MELSPDGTFKITDPKKVNIKKRNQKRNKNDSSRKMNQQKNNSDVPLNSSKGINGETIFLNQQQNNTQQTAMPSSTKVKVIITPDQ